MASEEVKEPVASYSNHIIDKSEYDFDLTGLDVDEHKPQDM